MKGPLEMTYRHLLGMLSAPWAITPEAFKTVCGIVGRRVEGSVVVPSELLSLYEPQKAAYAERAERIAAALGTPAAGGRGVAVLSLYGTIAPRANLMTAVSGGVSLEQFADAFAALDADPNVGHIVLDIDSPGGATDLVPETAALIAGARTPTTAVANTLAASAAYWLACQCDDVVVTPSGFVGSIGVLSMHTDASVAMDNAGMKVTLISAGPYKTEGNPYEPLGDEARAARQSTVDEFYSMFLDAVASGRGVSPDEVEANMGGGRVMTAAQALGAGAVDRVETFDSTLARVLGSARTGGRMGAVAAADDIAVGEPLIPVDQRLHAGPIPARSTPVVDEPWDADKEVGAISNDAGADVLRREFAWVDSNGDPDEKGSYKFPHHRVVNGEPEAANVNGVRNALARLSEADIPEGDSAGVKAHLQRHLDDFHAKQTSSAQPAEGLGGAPKTPATDAVTRSLELRALRRRASGR